MRDASATIEHRGQNRGGHADKLAVDLTPLPPFPTELRSPIKRRPARAVTAPAASDCTPAVAVTPGSAAGAAGAKAIRGTEPGCPASQPTMPKRKRGRPPKQPPPLERAESGAASDASLPRGKRKQGSPAGAAEEAALAAAPAAAPVKRKGMLSFFHRASASAGKPAGDGTAVVADAAPTALRVPVAQDDRTENKNRAEAQSGAAEVLARGPIAAGAHADSTLAGADGENGAADTMAAGACVVAAVATGAAAHTAAADPEPCTTSPSAPAVPAPDVTEQPRTSGNALAAAPTHAPAAAPNAPTIAALDTVAAPPGALVAAALPAAAAVPGEPAAAAAESGAQPGRSVLLFDDFDLLLDEDPGFLASVAALLEKSKVRLASPGLPFCCCTMPAHSDERCQRAPCISPDAPVLSGAWQRFCATLCARNLAADLHGDFS